MIELTRSIDLSKQRPRIVHCFKIELSGHNLEKPMEFLRQVDTHPKNIILLTCDAFGVLPPVAKLTPEQVQYPRTPAAALRGVGQT